MTDTKLPPAPEPTPAPAPSPATLSLRKRWTKDTPFIGARIIEARQKKGLQQNELADLVGVSPQAVAQWESNTTAPRTTNLSKLAEVLGVDFDWLVGGILKTSRMDRAYARLQAPLVSRVVAGSWKDNAAYDWDMAAETKILDLLFPAQGQALGLEIESESMAPEFQPGDIIIIDTGLEPLPGDYVVAKLASEEGATFKRYRPRGLDDDGQPVIELMPLNPDYPTLQLSARNPGHIVGTMIEHRRFRRRR